MEKNKNYLGNKVMKERWKRKGEKILRKTKQGKNDGRKD